MNTVTIPVMMDSEDFHIEVEEVSIRTKETSALLFGGVAASKMPFWGRSNVFYLLTRNKHLIENVSDEKDNVEAMPLGQNPLNGFGRLPY